MQFLFNRGGVVSRSGEVLHFTKFVIAILLHISSRLFISHTIWQISLMHCQNGDVLQNGKNNSSLAYFRESKKPDASFLGLDSHPLCTVFPTNITLNSCFWKSSPTTKKETGRPLFTSFGTLHFPQSPLPTRSSAYFSKMRSSISLLCPANSLSKDMASPSNSFRQTLNPLPYLLARSRFWFHAIYLSLHRELVEEIGERKRRDKDIIPKILPFSLLSISLTQRASYPRALNIYLAFKETDFNGNISKRYRFNLFHPKLTTKERQAQGQTLYFIEKGKIHIIYPVFHSWGNNLCKPRL